MICSVVKHLGSGYSTQEVGRRFYLNSPYQLIPLTDAESQFLCSFELPCYCYDYLHEKNLDEIRIVSYLSLK